MKLLLELTEKHLDLIKGELRIPEEHYDYLLATNPQDLDSGIPEQYAQSLRILKVRHMGLGMGNSKQDCCIPKDNG